MGRMTKVLVVDFIWAFFNGFLPSSYVAVSVLGWLVFAFIAAMIVSQTLIDMEAKKRTSSTPITSFDQISSTVASLILVAIIGVVGFLVGDAITPF